jgi:RNA polymerase sigma-70 factor, ECF subfamily
VSSWRFAADFDAVDAVLEDAEVAFEMDEDSFRAFYDRTARALWSYLARMTADPHLADDLLQEAYYRFLRIRGDWESETHRRAYLFRIATNLVRDGRRRSRLRQLVTLPDGDRDDLGASGPNVSDEAVRRTDLQRAMDRLRPRERALLWLAYAQGRAHAEIAETLGVKTGSVKLLLFRARRKLAGLLRAPDSGTSKRTSGGQRREDR